MTENKIPEDPERSAGARERYDIFQRQIDHETDTHNQKIIYHVISQSFFFGAYSGLMNAPKEPRDALFGAQQGVLFWVLPIAALGIALLTAASIVASVVYVEQLTREYRRAFPKSPPGLPSVNGSGLLRKVSHLSSYGLPAAIILAWITILGFQTKHWLGSA